MPASLTVTLFLQAASLSGALVRSNLEGKIVLTQIRKSFPPVGLEAVEQESDLSEVASVTRLRLQIA